MCSVCVLLCGADWVGVTLWLRCVDVVEEEYRRYHTYTTTEKRTTRNQVARLIVLSSAFCALCCTLLLSLFCCAQFILESKCTSESSRHLEAAIRPYNCYLLLDWICNIKRYTTKAANVLTSTKQIELEYCRLGQSARSAKLNTV